MEYRNPNVSMGGAVCINEYEKEITNSDRVRTVLQLLEQSV
jgi:hypothetical protein